MTKKPPAENTGLAVYKRLLRQTASTDQIGELATVLCRRLQTNLVSMQADLGWDMPVTSTYTGTGFDFRKHGSALLVALGTAPDKFTTCIAAQGSDAARIVDLLLGDDPNSEPIEDASELGELQRALLDDFWEMIGDCLQPLLMPDTTWSASATTASAVQAKLGDYAVLNIAFGEEPHLSRLQVLVSQKNLLRLRVRATGEEERPFTRPNLVPEKDVSIRVDGIVSLPGMTLSDISFLKVGDRIALTENPASEIFLAANGCNLHKCRLGQDQNLYALQVEGPFRSLAASIGNGADQATRK